MIEPDMESVLTAMSTTLEVTEDSAPLEHPRYSQYYKNYGAEVKKQKARREDWMKRQQEGRSARFEIRRSNPTNQNEEATSSLEENSVEMADFGKGRQATSKPGSWKSAMSAERSRYFRADLKGRLMYSEWLIDVPEDFSQKWVMVPAPKAKRVIIVFENGICQLFTKAGKQLNMFKTPSFTSTTVILDGFVNGKDVYILDFLQTGDLLALENCDFGCRQLLGKNFLTEKYVLKKNQLLGNWNFIHLEPIVCTKEKMEELLSKPTPYELDGLMFYHTEGVYTPGITPLVTWLKPWMMTDMLNVQVSPIYMTGADGTAKEFMENFAKDHPTYGRVLTEEELAGRNSMEVTAE